jgi:hypothetical protein
MSNVLVSGSNRSIGLEWCRQPEAADALHDLALSHPRLSIHRLDEEKMGSDSIYHLCQKLIVSDPTH